MIRLDKFLCDMEIGSRSQVKDMIKKGQVSVNGQVIKKAEHKFEQTASEVKVNGEVIGYQKNYYYMLHKPGGVVSATTDCCEKTVMELLKDAPGKDMFPVGRLDKDTEGLLLISNDGELAHRLLSPKKHVEKTYLVVTESTITAQMAESLEKGVDIGEKKKTLPARVRLLEDKKIELTIVEGKFHQVKRMLKAVGNEVTYLKRLSMGPLRLDETLKKGEFRALTEEELKALKKG